MKHRLTNLIGALLLATSSVIALAQPTTAATAPELGMATGGTLLTETAAERDARLQDMKNLGVTWIRVDFPWDFLEPNSPTQTFYSLTDPTVQAAAKYGIKIDAMLAYTPGWARPAACKQYGLQFEQAQQKCAPDPTTFAAFAARMATHYKNSAVKAWDIWNEPNLTGFWESITADYKVWVSPSDYAAVANAAAASIHAITPGATVVAGGFAPVFDPKDPRGMRQGDYLRQLAPLLTKGGVTAIAVHPYTWPAYPHVAENWNAFYTVDHGPAEYNLQAILAAAGRSDLPIWGTEFGASTSSTSQGDPESTDPSVSSKNPSDYVDETAQSSMLKEGVQLWYAKPNVGPLFLYADSDQYLPVHKNEGGFGLRRRDGTAKPAYAAVQAEFKAVLASSASSTVAH